MGEWSSEYKSQDSLRRGGGRGTINPGAPGGNLSVRDTNYDIAVINADGSGYQRLNLRRPTRLSNWPSLDPRWSP